MKEMNELQGFHPLIQQWFQQRFAGPTEAQRLGWPAIQERRDTLIAAPTGSGKTLTAFLASLDRLLRLALAGELRDQTYVVYVSPLRALSNDIQLNLQAPLAEILELARLEHPDCPEIRALVRTGDTPAKERQRMLRHPPHILVTTPESLYLVLTGKRSHSILRQVETVIVDEIHAVARDKRGSHLSLSLERLENLSAVRPIQIGLSATQKPLAELARFLVGSPQDERINGPTVGPACRAGLLGPSPVRQTGPAIVDIGHFRDLDLAVEVPQRPLQAVCTHEHWAEVYEQLVKLLEEHRSTLIFVNTRKLAERVAHQLTARLGKDKVLSHHGSMSHNSRKLTEQGLKNGDLKAVVATASLELGIDIGHIGLVCQLGTPRSIATFLQRVGRAGHALGLVPKGRLFALSREELIECLALIRAVREGRLDRIEIPQAPLDILAQQIVAAVACEDWDEDALFEFCRRAYPYRNLSRADYQDVLEMLSEGMAPQRGRYGAYLHRDRVNRRLHARKGARLTAITCGGAIPEIADYRVVTDDENRTLVGTLDEDFAVESNGGDIFLLGNTSWRIKHIRGGEVVVTDAHPRQPTYPLWHGQATGRTVELSAEVARLRQDMADLINRDAAPSPCPSPPGGRGHDGEAIDWVMQTCLVSRNGADQAIDYVTAQYVATGMVPSQKRLLFERFFDESGGMQLVIHAPFGTRINRAWGLALRKRFCRTFDFELQASAGDNGIVLSLCSQHSFLLEQMFKLVPSHLARDVLVQAFLAVPFFATRWRWNITRALQLKRTRNGQRVPPHLQRMRADDLMSAVFPAQTACQENVVGDIEIPKQPLVQQTLYDCLHEAADLEGLLGVLRDLESGAIEVVGLDTREPSPFAHELLNSNPFSFLDDAPLEERRARAVTMRRSLPAEALRDLGRLDPQAIAQVRSEAWPVVRDADELHDVLLSQGALPATEGECWREHFEELRSTGRATTLTMPSPPGGEEMGVRGMWVATERWPLIHAVWPDARARPEVSVPADVRQDWPREEAMAHLVRGRIECLGPVTVNTLAQGLGLHPSDVEGALATLEMQGVVLRGRFTEEVDLASVAQEWCDRRLLARIHRLTLEGLRQQIAAVPPEQFVRFLVRHQHMAPHFKMSGQTGLLALIEQLEGFEAPAGHWEKYLLPARLETYNPEWLDGLTFFGQVVWGRVRPQSSLNGVLNTDGANGKGKPIKAFTRSTPITLMLRDHVPWLLPPANSLSESLNFESQIPDGNARAALEALLAHGALFPAQLGALLQLVPSQVEDVLGELAAAGLVTSDGYPALRRLIGGQKWRLEDRRSGFGRPGMAKARQGRASTFDLPSSFLHPRSRGVNGGHPPGRWTLLRSQLTSAVDADQRTEHWCRLLLRRYGVMFRDLLANESAAPSWQALVRTYRRLEARGEIRGGRFVAGVAGEQYALPEVISMLRSVPGRPKPGRPKPDDSADTPLVLPSTDPLNFTGRFGSGPRVPAQPGYSIVVANGVVKANEPTSPPSPPPRIGEEGRGVGWAR
jgi:ATP-dependent Lhr-like helicase